MQVFGLDETLNAIRLEFEHKTQQADRGLSKAGLAYQRDVQSFAPVDTGQYRSTIRCTRIQYDALGNPYVIIGTPMPQACRLEFGFDNKTDSLGRTFHQKPRPHFGRAMALGKDRYFRIIRAEIDQP